MVRRKTRSSDGADAEDANERIEHGTRNRHAAEVVWVVQVVDACKCYEVVGANNMIRRYR
ncbi:MAG: hypothetical protein M1399_08050 [Actinobacteria bacterium]|nr:hypothetical protein [Actinomycetota bacterium]MCL5446608.1 hypothetical protein [Actinomycetota bacterium]